MNKDAVGVERPLTTDEAEKAILGAYARGVLSRGGAMQQLGLDWYGDLLQRVNHPTLKGWGLELKGAKPG